VYVYLFEWESPAFDGLLGACHALELPFVFGAVHIPVVQLFSGSGPEVQTLSSNMQAAWLAFARGGDPSHVGISTWHPWSAERRATLVFGPRTGEIERPRDAELAVLERYRPLASPVAS
jgi:para-nitrobenzyl esterase